MSIPNDIIGSANVSYLGDPFEQYCGLNGKPLIGGHIEVYLAGTSDKYMTLQDFDGDYNPFKVPLGADGRVVMLADPSLTYDIYVYNSYNDLVCSRLNVECTCPGNISIKGADTWVRNTDGTLDISLRTSANNRRVFDVNTRNKRLDVQSPLYFVENSETATVIGFSGDDYATTADLADKMDISKLEYNEDGEISAYDGSAFAGQGGAGDPEVNELVHSNSAEWNDVSAKLDTTAFSTVSGNFLTAIPDNYATKDYVQSSVSSKLDTTAFSTVSGNFLTAVPEGYATEDWVTAQGYLTAHQSLDGLMSADLLEISDNKITGYNGTAFAGQGGGDYELSAGSGISIEDFPLEQKTVISVTAQGGNTAAEQAVIDNSATWNTVSDKLDTTAFSDVSGTFLTAHQDLSDYQTIAGMTAYQEAGDYLTTGDSANFATTGDIEDLVSAICETYQPITAMTAYQAAGDYLTTADSAEFYTTANDSGFITNDAITGKQDITGMTAYQPVGDYVQGSDLSLNSYDKISAISGHEIAGGGSVDFDYDSDGNISGINSSAISDSRAGTPLYVESPLFTGQSGDSAYIGVSGYVWQSALLFHTDTPITQTTYTLSDNCSNYDRLDVDFYDINNWRTVMECSIPTNLDASGTRGGYFSVVPASTATGANVWFKAFNWTAANTTWSCYCSEIAAQGGSTTQIVNANQPQNPPKVVNIIGWKRVGV